VVDVLLQQLLLMLHAVHVTGVAMLPPLLLLLLM